MVQLKNIRFFTILSFILLGLASRFFPHPPNFTAINAMALFGISALGSLNLTLLTIFLIMFFSDLVLGFHTGLLFVYLSFGTISCMGYWFRKNNSSLCKSTLLITSSILFFSITNFGVWLTSAMYPQSLLGLEACYFAALPFLANQIIGDFFYYFLLVQIFYLYRAFYSVQIPSLSLR